MKAERLGTKVAAAAAIATAVEAAYEAEGKLVRSGAHVELAVELEHIVAMMVEIVRHMHGCRCGLEVMQDVLWRAEAFTPKLHAAGKLAEEERMDVVIHHIKQAMHVEYNTESFIVTHRGYALLLLVVD